MSAKYISAVTSPFLIIPLFALWVIAVYSKTFGEFLIWTATFIIFAVLFPFAYVYHGIKKGKLTDLHALAVMGEEINLVLSYPINFQSLYTGDSLRAFKKS